MPDVNVPAGTSFRWLNWLGHILIKSVEIEIGGQRINENISAQKYLALLVRCAATEESHWQCTNVKTADVSQVLTPGNAFKLRGNPKALKTKPHLKKGGGEDNKLRYGKTFKDDDNG